MTSENNWWHTFLCLCINSNRGSHQLIMSRDIIMFDYTKKHILAPMVRIGTLPIRLLALECGADLVYSEELIDYRLLKCRRIENVLLGSVDFVDPDNQIIYRTCNNERGRNILQIGTCSPERAVKVSCLSPFGQICECDFVSSSPYLQTFYKPAHTHIW